MTQRRRRLFALVTTAALVLAAASPGAAPPLPRLGPDPSVQPALAESWTIAPDGRQITLRLRAAKFHNGDPLTSADVKFTYERILNAQTKAGAPAVFGGG